LLLLAGENPIQLTTHAR